VEIIFKIVALSNNRLLTNQIKILIQILKRILVHPFFSNLNNHKIHLKMEEIVPKVLMFKPIILIDKSHQ
jgi:hypothetical protein